MKGSNSCESGLSDSRNYSALPRNEWENHISRGAKRVGYAIGELQIAIDLVPEGLIDTQQSRHNR